MSTVAIVALLQSALLLLTAAQTTPNLPQSFRENAVSVAQEAISEATAALSASSTAPITSPEASAATSTVPSEYASTLQVIDAFLANPTPSSVVTFCQQSESVPGPGSQTQLNSARTSLVQTQDSLYQDVSWCLNFASSTADHYLWTTYNPSYLLPLTNSTDTDQVREAKIEYNEAIQAYATSSVFGYFGEPTKKGAPVLYQTPDEVAQVLLSQATQEAFLLNDFPSYVSFVNPVTELQQIRDTIEQ